MPRPAHGCDNNECSIARWRSGNKRIKKKEWPEPLLLRFDYLILYAAKYSP